MKPLAEIEDPIVARKILEHLGLSAEELEFAPARGPPQERSEEDGPPVLEDEWM